MNTNNNGFLLTGQEWFEQARKLRREDSIFHVMCVELKRRCDTLLQPDNPMYLNPEDRSSAWWKTRPGTKQLVIYTLDLSMAAHLFQDRHYSDTAAKVMKILVDYDMANNSGGTCYGMPYKSWLANPLDAGHASEALGLSLNLLMPFLEKKEALKTGKYLMKFMAAMEGFIKPAKNVYGAQISEEKYLNLHNIPMIGRLSMGVLAASLEKLGIVNTEKHMDISRCAALQYLDNGGHEEGILPEGPMYGFACLKHIAVLGTILSRKGDDSIWKSSAWDRIVESYASQIIPSEGMPNPWNDCYPARITSWLLAVARHRRNGLARWLWETMVQPTDKQRWDAPAPWTDIRAPWWTALLPHAMVSYDPSVQPSSPAESGLPLHRYFTNRGIYDDRSGWDENDWYMTTTCLPDIRWRNRIGHLHNQADRGHFSLYALGEQFAIDSGYGNESLSGTTEVIRFGHSGESHNVPEIGGEMQQGSTYAQGFREIRPDGWVRLARMEFAECYSNCIRASRTIMIVTDEKKFPLYAAIYDCVVPRRTISTFGLLLHTHEKNRVSLIDRETADIEGGCMGNHCRVFMTAVRPGRITMDNFLGHPRMRYQNQGENLHAVTILVPYLKGKKAPVIERSSYHAAGANTGFSVNICIKDVKDTLMLCKEGNVTALDYETDAGLSIVRKADKPKLAVIDATYLKINGDLFFSAAQRTTMVKE